MDGEQGSALFSEKKQSRMEAGGTSLPVDRLKRDGLGQESTKLRPYGMIL